jgi:spore germination cell wall hydrolase CwlJ-like protein
MASAISNRYYERVIKTTQGTMVIMGLLFIAALLVSVTTAKFEHLRASMQAQDQSIVSANLRMKQLDCLTKNIYWEAASEPFEGKVAVAQVTMNRVNDGRFGDGVCGVVYQKNVVYEKVICQFSWACENTHKIKPIYPKYWEESQEVAKKVLMENFRLPSLHQALYYHADYVSPGWRKQKITKIGQHIFYKE